MHHLKGFILSGHLPLTKQDLMHRLSRCASCTMLFIHILCVYDLLFETCSAEIYFDQRVGTEVVFQDFQGTS